MRSAPALSILLPTWNGARFLTEQIESIKAQSFTDWELIVCDDGSSDGTPALLEEQAQADPRIRLIPTSGNLGQKRRLRELLAVARAELIAVSDQDDVWQPDKLALLLAARGDADLCFGSSWLIDAAGRPLGRALLENFAPPVRPDDRLIYLFRPTVSAHAMIVRRRLLEGAGLIRARPFDWLLALEATFSGGVVFEPAAKTMHRMHDANQMNGANIRRSARSRLVSVGRTWNHHADVIGRRLMLVEFAEHLALSGNVSRSVAKCFAEVHKIGMAAWFESPRRGQSAIRDRLRVLLRPFAGSEHDWHYADRAIDTIGRVVFDPQRVVQHVRNVLAGA